MPYCPDCAVEIDDPHIAACPHCGALMQEGDLPESEGPVVVLEAHDVTEAQVAEATLEAEGIPAYVSPPGSLVPNVDVMGDEPPELDVYVAPENAEEARQVLSSQGLTEEELTGAEEADIGPKVADV